MVMFSREFEFTSQSNITHWVPSWPSQLILELQIPQYRQLTEEILPDPTAKPFLLWHWQHLPGGWAKGMET